MKIKKLMLLVLASMAMGALAGCGKNNVEPEPEPQPEETMPEEYDLLEHWEGNQGEEVYSVTKNAAGATVITYTDATGEEAGGWQYVKRSFAYDSAKVAKFNVYKKVIFEGQMTTTAGSNVVMVKVEGTDAAHTWEKKFTFAAEVKTYEFGLNFVSDWTKVQQVLFFVNRGTNVSGSGVITLTKMALSKQEVVSANDIAPGMPTIPQGYAYYDAVDEAADAKFDVMYHWGYAADHVVTEQIEGGYKFTADAQCGWNYVTSRVQNRDAQLKDSGFKRLVFKVKGTVGQKVILKFECEGGFGATEQKAVLTAEEQLVELNIAGLIATDATSFMAMIFPTAGFSGEAFAGEVILTGCYFDKTEVTAPTILDNKGEYHQLYLDNPASYDIAYEITSTPANHTNVINYKLDHAPDYRGIQFKLRRLADDGNEWFGEENFRRVVGKFTSTVDVGIIVKAFDKVEFRLELKANEPQAIDQYVEKTDVDFTKPMIIMVGTSEGSALAGSITVEGLRLCAGEDATKVNVDDANGVVRITNYKNAANTYTIGNDDDGDLAVVFNHGTFDWQSFESRISAAHIGSLNTIKGTLISSVGVTILFKPANVNANEKSVTLEAGVAKEINLEFTTPFQEGWDQKLVIFIGTGSGDPTSGSVAFKNLRLTDGTHDTIRYASPVGNYYGYAQAGDGQVFINLALGGLSGLSHLETYDTEVHNYDPTGYEYNQLNKKLVVKTGDETLGDLEGEYDVANDKLIKVGFTGAAQYALSNNGEVELAQAGHFWSCNNPLTLNSVFGRRSRPTSTGSWNTTLGTLGVETEEYVSGNVAIRRPGATEFGVAEQANGVVLRSDFSEAVAMKNLAFWVYNPTDAVIKIRCWVFKAANFQSWQDFTLMPAQPNAWTYIRVGGTYNIYNFNLSTFNDNGNNVNADLLFDNIALF